MRVVYTLLAVLGIAFLSSCANPKELVFQDVKNFSVNSISLTPDIGMDVQFYNPNKFGMTLKDANVDLYINGLLVGKATLPQSYKVEGMQTFLLPVNLKADLKSILSNSVALMANKKVDVELKGTVKAGKGAFINIPINYKGTQELHVTGF